MPRLVLFALLLPLAAQSAAPPLAAVGADAQRAHASGTCGTLGPGTGLTDGRGWVVSMLPGRHEFRMRGAGTVYVTTARLTAHDFDAGRPYYLVIEGATPQSVLEWKTPASNWAPIPSTFLYPLQR